MIFYGYWNSQSYHPGGVIHYKLSHNYVLSLVGRSGRSFWVNEGTEKLNFESSAMVHKFVMTMTKDVVSEERKRFIKY